MPAEDFGQNPVKPAYAGIDPARTHYCGKELRKRRNIDPETGMVDSTYFRTGFTAKRKKLILAFLERAPFRVSKACKTVGISLTAFYYALQIDPVFKSRVENAMRGKIEEAEHVLAEEAGKPLGIRDREVLLKAWKPERYNPVQVVRHVGNPSPADLSSAQGFLDRQDAMEAEIAKSLSHDSTARGGG